ncbi:3-deoxy-7-phosphoheptulonate synthase [Photorhabdus cinerea]|uniref:3-deoxy-7-phosphoheptulonate synthase n=1 Tax=Photorhabdus cinerea TaxID=471575 RepID=UPI0030DBB67E
MAGQYAKPRSNAIEKYQNITLPVWRGDCINSPEPVLAEDIVECFGCGFNPKESELSNIIMQPTIK